MSVKSGAPYSLREKFTMDNGLRTYPTSEIIPLVSLERVGISGHVFFPPIVGSNDENGVIAHTVSGE